VNVAEVMKIIKFPLGMNLYYSEFLDQLERSHQSAKHDSSILMPNQLPILNPLAMHKMWFARSSRLSIANLPFKLLQCPNLTSHKQTAY